MKMNMNGRIHKLMMDAAQKYTLFEKQIWNLFIEPDEVTEIRILGVYGNSSAWQGYSKGTVSGYFDNHEAFCSAIKAANKVRHTGIYFTLQVIDPRLLGRALNRLKAAKTTTSDQNIIAYRWLPVDIDPNRPSGVSASDAELQEALQIRNDMAQYAISELGFTPPIRAVSGNGGHLLFRLPDMLVSDQTKLFVHSTLSGLSEKFSTDKVSIDTSVHNPARIWKLYGTTARKGDEVPAGPNREARPHRMSYIDDLGEFEDG